MTDPKKEMMDKPLDKMTVTELREIAKEIPEITGAHGMKKAELLEAVKAAKGIVDEPVKKPAGQKKLKTHYTVQELKALIHGLKSKRRQALEANDKKTARICRRRISRLKKKTRQAA
jgi:DNA-binding ferritin-like protein